MKKQKRRFWCVILLVLLMFVSTGCDRASETLSEWKQDFKQDVAMDDTANTSQNRLEVPRIQMISQLKKRMNRCRRLVLLFQR